MAYRKPSAQTQTAATRASRGLETTSQAGFAEGEGDFYELEVAEVVDVILSPDNPNYISDRDIGKVKFRFINSQKNKPETELYLAKPFDANIQKYPLIHEAVLVAQAAGQYYYLDVLPFRMDVNQNAVPKISETPAEGETGQSRQQTYQENSAGLSDSRASSEEVAVGETFEPSTDPKPLEPDEGDVVIQGRFGNTARFGSNPENQSATILLACGQSQEAKDKEQRARVRENVDEDAASLYMTEDTVVDLVPSTEGEDAHHRSVENPPQEYGGKQAILKSDRLVLDSRSRQFHYASEGYHVASAANHSTDAGGTIYRKAGEDIRELAEANLNVEVRGGETRTVDGDRTIEVGGSENEEIGGEFFQETGDRAVFSSPNVYIGSEGASEPLVLGDSWASLFEDLIQYIDNHTHQTPVGPTSPPVPPSAPQLQPQVQPTLSQSHFTEQ